MATTLIRMRLSLGPLGRLIGSVFIVFIVYKKIDNKQEYRFIFELHSSRIRIDFDSQDRDSLLDRASSTDNVHYVDDFLNYSYINLICLIISGKCGDYVNQ